MISHSRPGRAEDSRQARHGSPTSRTMGDFKEALDRDLSGGEQIRTELCSGAEAEQGEAVVSAWLRKVDGSFATVPRLREMLRPTEYPSGMSATYEGLSEEEGRSVWRVEVRLQDLQPLLVVVAPYVEALRGA